MFQAFRMQLRQILDGNKKWFVGLFLVLPIALTWLAMSSGLGDVKRHLEGGELVRSVHSENAERVVWDGEDIELPARITVQEGRVLYHNRRVRASTTIIVKDGWIVVENGQVWVDASREGDGEPVPVFKQDRGIPEIDAPWDLICLAYLFLLYSQTVCLLLALLYGSSLLGSELDNRTLTYLWTRPVARWRLVVGKYLAIVSVLIPPTLVSLTVSWWLMGHPGGNTLPALLATSVGGTLGYNAVFVLLGFLAPKRAMILALLYGVILEFLLSFVPAMVNTFTVTYYLRSLAIEITGLEVPDEIARIAGGASWQAATITLVVIIFIGLHGSSWLATRREYVVADQA